MIPGCAQVQPPAPVVVELTRARCPDLPEADRSAFAARASRPRADITGDDGRPWVSVHALQAAIDQRDLIIARMARAGAATVEVYHRCRDGAPGHPQSQAAAEQRTGPKS